MGAWQLRQYLDVIQPDIVLIEGLNDANSLIPDMVRAETRPPVAILAYTDSLPVRTLVYPLATYSPEYQAIKWAVAHNAEVEFIDLPSERFLGLQDLEVELFERARSDAAKRSDAHPPHAAEPSEKEIGGWKPPLPHEDHSPETAETAEPSSVPEPQRSLYERYAELAGEYDYESYWERDRKSTRLNSSH